MINRSSIAGTGWDTLDAFQVQNRQLPKIADAIDMAALAIMRYAPLDRSSEKGSFFQILMGDVGAEFQSLRLNLLLRYWLQRAEHGIPHSTDLDPTDIEALLSNIMIVELFDEPFRVFYHLVGSEVARFTGLEFTGHYLDEFVMDAFNLEAITHAYKSVRDSGKPGAGVEVYVTNGECRLKTEYLICPLRTGTAVDRCIVVEDYFLNAATQVSDLHAARWRSIADM